MAESAIARVTRPRRTRPTTGRTITLPPEDRQVLCTVMAWAAGYLVFDDPAATHDLYQRQVEVALNQDLTLVRAQQLTLTLRDGAQSMPQNTRRGKALRRLLNAAADTIAAEARP